MKDGIFEWKRTGNGLWEDGRYWIVRYSHSKTYNANFGELTGFDYADLGDHETFEEAVTACYKHWSEHEPTRLCG